jgi:hypothetical protein
MPAMDGCHAGLDDSCIMTANITCLHETLPIAASNQKFVVVESNLSAHLN